MVALDLFDRLGFADARYTCPETHLPCLHLYGYVCAWMTDGSEKMVDKFSVVAFSKERY